jgi:hypothetical protein
MHHNSEIETSFSRKAKSKGLSAAASRGYNVVRSNVPTWLTMACMQVQAHQLFMAPNKITLKVIQISFK